MCVVVSGSLCGAARDADASVDERSGMFLRGGGRWQTRVTATRHDSIVEADSEAQTLAAEFKSIGHGVFIRR